MITPTSTDAPIVYNEPVIAQWRKDLLDKEFGLVFNADYSIITNDNGVFEGDASLFLAYRNADITGDNRLIAWYDEFTKQIPPGDYSISEYIVNKFTGIPLETARKLMWPECLLEADYDLSKITPQQFVQILDIYMETGAVGWDIYLAQNAENA